MRYLSDAWIQAIGDAAARVPVDEVVDVPPIVIQTVVTDGGEHETAYHLVIRGSSLAVRPGRASEPTVTFTQTHETATAVASGKRSAQEAFMAGDIRVGGDVTALIDHRDALAAFDEVMAEVHVDTEF